MTAVRGGFSNRRLCRWSRSPLLPCAITRRVSTRLFQTNSIDILHLYRCPLLPPCNDTRFVSNRIKSNNYVCLSISISEFCARFGWLLHIGSFVFFADEMFRCGLNDCVPPLPPLHRTIHTSTLEVEAVRRDQFAEFAKAVQVGLIDFQGPQGIKAFFSLMRSRYGQVRVFHLFKGLLVVKDCYTCVRSSLTTIYLVCGEWI